MPAKSIKQQRFMGMVDAMQGGKMPKMGAAGDAAETMNPKDVKEFASTKHKGLPLRKKHSRLAQPG